MITSTSRASSITDKANRSPPSTAGQKGVRTLAKSVRTQTWSCCNYFNLNLAMARAVNDTPLLGKKVSQGHFNDHKGLCCALELKDATSRGTGPWSVGSGMGTDKGLDVICWIWNPTDHSVTKEARISPIGFTWQESASFCESAFLVENIICHLFSSSIRKLPCDCQRGRGLGRWGKGVKG